MSEREFGISPTYNSYGMIIEGLDLFLGKVSVVIVRDDDMVRSVGGFKFILRVWIPRCQGDGPVVENRGQ